jgi:hypothetical protein
VKTFDKLTDDRLPADFACPGGTHKHQHAKSVREERCAPLTSVSTLLTRSCLSLALLLGFGSPTPISLDVAASSSLPSSPALSLCCCAEDFWQMCRAAPTQLGRTRVSLSFVSLCLSTAARPLWLWILGRLHTSSGSVPGRVRDIRRTCQAGCPVQLGGYRCQSRQHLWST